MEHWTVREQLILGSAVQRSGDQNWVSVSRTIRPLSEENRQADFYSQKNCAMHYAALLDSASTPKRKKKRGSESETGETTQDLIVRELTEKRLTEITQLLDSISNEYHEVKKDLELIEKGQLSDDEVTNMWNKLKDVDYNEISVSQFVTDKGDNKEENVICEQKNDNLADVASDRMEPETVCSDKPLLTIKVPTAVSDAPKTLATPLIAAPISAPVGNSAALIKIEPNVAMETLGGAKPVHVKILSHDDHTYSSPGPPTLLATHTNSEEAKEYTTPVEVTEDSKSAVSQASLSVDQVNGGTTSNDTTNGDQVIPSEQPSVPSANHITANINQATFSNGYPTADQTTSNVDQAIPSVDQDIPSTDQDTPTVDQASPSVDQTSPSIDQATPNFDQITPSVDQATPSVDQIVSAIHQSDPSIDKVTAPDQGTIALDEVGDSIDQVANDSIDQPTGSVDHVTDQSISTVDKGAKDVITDDQATISMDDQAESSADKTTSVDHVTDQELPSTDLSVGNKPTEIDQTTNKVDNVATDSVIDHATPTTDRVTPSVDQTTPVVDHASPTTDQTYAPSDLNVSTSDQAMVTIEKKSRTRGSNRIASKMKMVGKVKSMRATSPRTMVIIGKQQSAVESDNEELQVHYKEPTRRLHRLMSNEPSESEEEPLSAVTSGVTSPSSSMIDEIDPEIAQSMKLWRKSVMLVWQHASQHKYASLFLHAVKDDEAAGYSEVVFRPMDLSLIKKKIETGVIRNDMEFQRDMLLMFQNALMYNSSNHDVYMMADEMRKDVMENIQDYLATQLMVHSNARTKMLRSRDSRRVEQQWNLKDEELATPLRKARHRLPSDESITSISGAPLAKKMRSRTNDD